MSTPPKPLRDSAKERLTDVTTGLYMISATCGLVDALCFLALGGVFAEMMTGNLLLMALSIGTGSALGQSAHNLAGYVVVAMLALAMGIQNAMVRVHGVPDIATNVMTVTFTGIFADSTPAGGTNRNWRRRMTSVGLFMAGAALGGLLLQFGTVWPLVLTSVVFSLAMIPLMFGEKPQ
jgi:uncharacterized membrane protein YoaK (UPF0700 family)